MKDIKVLGIDLAKNIFQLHGTDEKGRRVFRRRLNIIFATQLMPKEGFTWLTKNLDIFAVWLELLSEDSASSGTLALILDRADSIAIQEELINNLLPQHQRELPARRIGTFIDTPEDGLSDREELAAIKFIEWLLITLEAGKLTMNQVPLFNVAGGTQIGTETLKLFIREHPEFKNMMGAIQRGLEKLGLLKGASTEKNFTIAASIALPNSFQSKTSNNAKAARTTALELLSQNKIEQLSKTGQWNKKLEQQAASKLSPSGKPHG